MTESLEEKVRDNYHTVLMAKNQAGLMELNELISKSCNKEHFYYVNRISFDEFLSISDNIISTSACLGSPLNKLPDDHPRYIELASKYDFLEIQPHNISDQINYNQRLLRLSKELGKPLIVGTDTHSSSKYKAECRAVLMSAKGQSYGDEDALDLSYKNYDEIIQAFHNQGAIPEEEYTKALDNTNLLFDLTEDIELDVSIKYPILYGTREADAAKFREITYEMFEEKLQSGVIPQEQKLAFEIAIEEELRVLHKLDMEGFMLSMSELLRYCREQKFAIGPARGSVGGSRVAFITDIIDLNPETLKTVFSRFCNEDREEIGDIDVDCVESDRPAIFKYIVDRFGEDRTARVASFGTMQDKKVIDDVGRHLAKMWNKEHPQQEASNPWSLKNIAIIKNEYATNQDKARKKYSQIFYYFDGLIGTKQSQSVHPAGMVISPIDLVTNFGVFDKDGETCLLLDMENVHDYTGLAKYDFLILKTVQVLRDACNYIGVSYPRNHEINFNDKDVWEDMIDNPTGVFQFEGKFAFDCLKKFQPQNIFDMSIVTACIRPSGTSYRTELLNRQVHHNPSEIIDELLEENLGYLIYQEDTIRFLQEICGLSGSEADNIRRAIGRKQEERLQKALPSILDGYCDKSPKNREEAEEEAKQFLQIIEDSANYQFGRNHSIAYCILGYLCAYYRYYHKIEFITSFLNNAANEDDIRNGTVYASKSGIKVTMPRWGVSKSEYFYDVEQNMIAKGLSSVKYMNSHIADELYEVAHSRKFNRFVDVLGAIDSDTSIDARQLTILIKIDFFSEFGNQKELLEIMSLFYDMFKKGQAKQINKTKVDGTIIEEAVKKYAVGITKAGGYAKSYTLLDVESILNESEDAIKSIHMDDLSDIIKVKNFAEVMGYVGYTSGKEEDRKKLYVIDMYELVRKKDQKQFGYSIVTKSVGSGVESRFTVVNSLYDKNPIQKGDIIYCKSFSVNSGYFRLTAYDKIS